MYPLTAVLIGCDDLLFPELRPQLSEQGIKIEAEYPTVAKAVSDLTITPGDRRFFFLHVPSAAECRHLERLNEAFLGRPIVALLDGMDDPALLVQAMRSGAAQVIPLPLRPDDFKRALDRIALQYGFPTSVSRVVAVTGVCEGVGATTLAINLAAELALRHQVPTLLAELSLRLGRLASCLDLDPRFTTHDLLRATGQNSCRQLTVT